MVVAMILAVMFHYVDGYQKIVYVSELNSDNKDFYTNAYGEDDNSHICCAYGNYICNSLDHALASLTSNVLINITTDMTLSSLIVRLDLQNVSVVGLNNPTVNCKTGGMHLTFCHNCIIQGITWDGCGTEITDDHIEPGIKLNGSSNVIIQNCCFQHSIGQAFVLTEVSGDVNINNCNFVNNSHYGGHGAVIQYSPNHSRNFTQFAFKFNNCNVTNNRYSKSLVENSNVTFIQNLAVAKGASITLKTYSTCQFDHNSIVTFKFNKATKGSAIYSEANSNVTFKATCKVMFTGNSAAQYGAAIYSSDYSHVIFAGSARVTFNNNVVSDNKNIKSCTRGVLYCKNNCHIFFKENSAVLFTDNIAGCGGAINLFADSHVYFEGHSITKFNKITATDRGGALYLGENSHISFEGNSTTEFSNNAADNGGAIFSDKNGYIHFKGSRRAVVSREAKKKQYARAFQAYATTTVSYLHGWSV